MRPLACVFLLALLAGCTSEPAALPLPGPVAAPEESAQPSPEVATPPPAPAFPRPLGTGRAELTAGKCAGADLPLALQCRPVMVMVEGVTFDVSAPEAEAARVAGSGAWTLLAEWTPAHPTSATLGVRLMEGQRMVAYAEGASPLRLALAAEELPPGRYFLDVVPATGVVVDQSVDFTLDLGLPAA